jgi:hypothetical protein
VKASTHGGCLPHELVELADRVCSSANSDGLLVAALHHTAGLQKLMVWRRVLAWRQVLASSQPAVILQFAGGAGARTIHADIDLQPAVGRRSVAVEQ